MRRLALLFTVLFVFALPHAARGQTQDLRLGDKIAGVVRDYPQFTIFDDVTIGVDAGTVTLSGCVTTPLKRDEIAGRVGKIDGVGKLVNNLHVLPVSHADSDLRVRVAQAIYGHPAFWEYAQMARPPIHIIVEAGQVTLTGVVNTDVERSLAYALAQVPGAFGVKNRLRLDR